MQKEAMLYEKLDDKMVRCFLCAHNCRIAPWEYGICGVRQNIEGELHTNVYAEAISANIDPIEKKPLYHFLPGSTSFSIATIGCNFKCGFCQNWQISQVNKRDGSDIRSYELSPGEIIRQAKAGECRSISYTYTEPTVFFEYAYDTAKLAKEHGLYNNFVTNGFMTKQALDTINPYLDAANIDLKSFSDDYYKKICKGRLQPVLDSIAYMKELGIWVEVTTLVIPDKNDSDDELRKIAEFIVSVSKDIPWHISRFYPQYEFTDIIPTPIRTLEKAKQIGEAAGLRYVYLGNVIEGNDTYCYECKSLLVKRTGFQIEQKNIQNGKCGKCGTEIKGIWE